MQFVNEIMRWKLGRISNSDLPGIATEAIASGAESPSLCVMATLNIFLNLYNIFISLLNLLMAFSGQRD